MTASLQLIHMLAALGCMVLVALGAIKAIQQQSPKAGQHHWLLAGGLLVALSSMDLIMRHAAAPAADTPASAALVAGAFPDAWSRTTGNSSTVNDTTASDANKILTGLTQKGSVIASGIWTGLTTTIPVLGTSLVVAACLIYLAWVIFQYVISPQPLQLAWRLVVGLFIVTAVLGRPDQAWLPRKMLAVADSLSTGVRDGLMASFDTWRKQQNGQIIADGDLFIMANAARVPQVLRPMAQLYAEAAQRYSPHLADYRIMGAGMAADLANGVWLTTGRPGIPMTERPIQGGDGNKKPLVESQSLPTELLANYDTDLAYAVYAGSDDKAVTSHLGSGDNRSHAPRGQASTASGSGPIRPSRGSTRRAGGADAARPAPATRGPGLLASGDPAPNSEAYSPKS